MPIVKKLKYDINGDGTETVIKVSIDSKGEFSADVPLYLKSATSKCVSGVATMLDAIKLVDEIVTEYQTLKRTEKWVILIEFKRDRNVFLNKGIGMKLSYLIANKKEFGKQVSYYVVDKDMSGQYREVGNTLSFRREYNDGVVAGESLELDYTEEKIKTIENLHSKLENLCETLSNLCNNETQFMQLVDNTFKLLDSGTSK